MSAEEKKLRGPYVPKFKDGYKHISVKLGTDMKNLGKPDFVLGRVTPSLTDHYTIGEVLGKGKFGLVKKAKNKEDGKVYACKTIFKFEHEDKDHTTTGMQDILDVEDVRKEVMIMKHLEGIDGVVHLRDTFEDKEKVHLVLELCTGGDLFDRVQQEVPYTEKKAAEMIRAVLVALSKMHQMGGIHREIKPENFLIDENGAIKFADFGLSTFFKKGQFFNEHLGSPNYMAPEVCGMRTAPQSRYVTKYNEKADIWSIGCVLYILLSGLPPFWGPQDQVYRQIRFEPVDYETDPWGSISEGAKRCCMAMLERDIKKRTTAEEILRDPWLCGNAPDTELSHAVADRIAKFSAHNKLIKQAMWALSDTLPADEIMGMKNMFEDLDKDKSGTITMDELRSALDNPSYGMTKEQIQGLLDAADLDGNRRIDWKEFLAATVSKSKLTREDRLSYIFSVYDADGNGVLDREEITNALRNQPGTTTNDIEQIFKDLDVNGDGKISYQEFSAKFFQGA